MHDPFGRTSKPPTFDREHRVKLLGQAAQSLLAGELPEPAARMFLASGLLAWLQGECDLLRDAWKVVGKAGSHRTPAALWAAANSSSEGATGDKESDTIPLQLQPVDHEEHS